MTMLAASGEIPARKGFCQMVFRPWLRKTFHALKWEYEKQRVGLKHLWKGPCVPQKVFPEFSIGIVTYLIRFNMFKALLKKVHKSFPEKKIIVAVNGYYQQDMQREYLDGIEEFARPYPNVSLLAHLEPQGLCRLWNEIILAAGGEKIFIMNDDLDIAPYFEDAFFESGILNEEMAIINGSWSHFLISKRAVERVGWFDERLYGVGGEDWDYEARLAFAGVPLKIVRVRGILNLSVYTTVFSFGENTERVNGKYTLSSAVFLRKKWSISTARDPDARFVRIWNDCVRLNEGYQTPVFYDFALLRRGGPPGMFGIAPRNDKLSL